MITVFLVVVGTARAQLCEDKDTAACQRLASIRPNMCTDSCFASICQRYCGKCRESIPVNVASFQSALFEAIVGCLTMSLNYSSVLQYDKSVNI